MDKYKQFIQSKICTLCHNILENDKNIVQYECGCCYCPECLKNLYNETCESKCLRCNNY